MFMILAIDIKIVGSVISVLYIYYVSWYTQPKSVSWRENTKKKGLFKSKNCIHDY